MLSPEAAAYSHVLGRRFPERREWHFPCDYVEMFVPGNRYQLHIRADQSRSYTALQLVNGDESACLWADAASPRELNLAG